MVKNRRGSIEYGPERSAFTEPVRSNDPFNDSVLTQARVWVVRRGKSWRFALLGAAFSFACHDAGPATTNTTGGAGALLSLPAGGSAKPTPLSSTGGATVRRSSTTATCSTGSLGCACYGNATCNASLSCSVGVCRESQPSTSSGGAGNGFESGGSGGTVGSASVHQGGLGIAGTTAVHQGGLGVAGKTSSAGGNVHQGGRAGTAGTGNLSTGNVAACAGTGSTSNACTPNSTEPRKPAVDLVLLIDRSIAQSYAFGSDVSASPTAGQVRRWDVLTTGIERFVSHPDAASVKASLTLFSRTGSVQISAECTANDYAQPVVALSNVIDNKTGLVQALKSIQPAGLTPTVPAVTGALDYAAAEQAREPSVEKALVLVTDGFPTLCDQRAPADLGRAIADGASAAVPIRTFIIGFAAPSVLSSAKFNLINYASMGGTGKPPYLIDETAGADAGANQLVQVLLDIAASPRP